MLGPDNLGINIISCAYLGRSTRRSMVLPLAGISRMKADGLAHFSAQ